MSATTAGDPTGLCIRDYCPADQPALIDLVRELQAHEDALHDRMKPPESIGAWYVDGLQESCRKHDGVILVAERGGAVAGYAVLLGQVGVAHDLVEIDYVYALVIDLAVTAPLRGTGIGRALLDACEAKAREAGARWMRIAALAGNEHALGVYRRAGYRDHRVTLEKALT